MTPTFGEIGGSPEPIAWAVGTWTSPLCTVSKQNFNNTNNNKWGLLRWREEGTSDETKAYVRVDILNSLGTVLQSNLAGKEVVNNVQFNKTIDLSQYVNVVATNIKIRFKLHNLSGNPKVSNIDLNSKTTW